MPLWEKYSKASTSLELDAFIIDSEIQALCELSRKGNTSLIGIQINLDNWTVECTDGNVYVTKSLPKKFMEAMNEYVGDDWDLIEKKISLNVVGSKISKTQYVKIFPDQLVFKEKDGPNHAPRTVVFNEFQHSWRDGVKDISKKPLVITIGVREGYPNTAPVKEPILRALDNIEEKYIAISVNLNLITTVVKCLSEQVVLYIPKSSKIEPIVISGTENHEGTITLVTAWDEEMGVVMPLRIDKDLKDLIT